MKKLDDKDLKKVDGGSTRIVIRSQTFAGKANRTGKNTLNATFNKGGSRFSDTKKEHTKKIMTIYK